MEKIHQVITALFELQAKGCHTIFFEYGNGTFQLRIIKGEVNAGNIVYEKTVNPTDKQAELEEIAKHVDNMKYFVCQSSYLCYKREFIKGIKSGEWVKTKPVFAVGNNATQAMIIDGSGYYIDDPDNGLQYHVNMNKLSDVEN